MNKLAHTISLFLLILAAVVTFHSLQSPVDERFPLTGNLYIQYIANNKAFELIQKEHKLKRVLIQNIDKIGENNTIYFIKGTDGQFLEVKKKLGNIKVMNFHSSYAKIRFYSPYHYTKHLQGDDAKKRIEALGHISCFILFAFLLRRINLCLRFTRIYLKKKTQKKHIEILVL